VTFYLLRAPSAPPNSRPSQFELAHRLDWFTGGRADPSWLDQILQK